MEQNIFPDYDALDQNQAQSLAPTTDTDTSGDTNFYNLRQTGNSVYNPILPNGMNGRSIPSDIDKPWPPPPNGLLSPQIANGRLSPQLSNGNHVPLLNGNTRV